jgi:hypothetical protein
LYRYSGFQKQISCKFTLFSLRSFRPFPNVVQLLAQKVLQRLGNSGAVYVKEKKLRLNNPEHVRQVIRHFQTNSGIATVGRVGCGLGGAAMLVFGAFTGGFGWFAGGIVAAGIAREAEQARRSLHRDLAAYMSELNAYCRYHPGSPSCQQ